MNNAKNTATIIHRCWTDGDVIDYDKSDVWPTSVDEGYAAQSALADLQGESVIGWKIAATALAGRAHINVDQPLAGRLFPSMCHQNGVVLPIKNNRMSVAEVEFVFTLGKDLPARETDYSPNEVSNAVLSLHPGLEIPDSRFLDFTKPGTAGLIADNACAANFILGEATSEAFEADELSKHPTQLLINDKVATTGMGSDALDGPLHALVWIANRLSQLGIGLKKGQFVTTGVTGMPTTISQGDTVCADLGKYGSVTATME